MSSIERICIEVRPRISCANVFLLFNESLNENSECLKVSLEKYKILIKNIKNNSPKNGWEIALNKYFNIVANSLNNFIVDDKNVSFRISIENLCEVLLNQQSHDKSFFNAINDISTPVIKENQKLSYFCTNCNNVITLEHCYKRLRPYPSSFIDPSEFFCHAKSNFNNLLIPEIDDLFFGYHYIIINRDILLNCETINFKSKGVKVTNDFYCNKCLKLIGMKIFDGSAIKLWSDSIGANICRDDQTNVNNDNNDKCKIFPALNTVSESYKLLMKIIRENSVVLDSNTNLTHNMLYIKAIVRTVSLLDSQQNEYLLLDIIEKDLQILQNQVGKSNQVNNHKGIKELQLYKALKIFYKIANTRSIQGNDNCYGQRSEGLDTSSNHIQPLLAYWEKDVSVIQIDISPYLFIELLNELESNVSILPKIYRETPKGFQVSHIFY